MNIPLFWIHNSFFLLRTTFKISHADLNLGMPKGEADQDQYTGLPTYPEMGTVSS